MHFKNATFVLIFALFFFRHTPANYLVDAAAAAAAGKSMRGTPQGTPIGLPASVSGLTIGRSSSPASRTPASMYQPGGLNQRVLSSADAAGQAAARYNFQAAAAAAAANPAALMGIRGDPAAYLRGNVRIIFGAKIQIRLLGRKVEGSGSLRSALLDSYLFVAYVTKVAFSRLTYTQLKNSQGNRSAQP